LATALAKQAVPIKEVLSVPPLSAVTTGYKNRKIVSFGRVSMGCLPGVVMTGRKEDWERLVAWIYVLERVLEKGGGGLDYKWTKRLTMGFEINLDLLSRVFGNLLRTFEGKDMSWWWRSMLDDWLPKLLTVERVSIADSTNPKKREKPVYSLF